jgi:hypothetical protein
LTVKLRASDQSQLCLEIDAFLSRVWDKAHSYELDSEQSVVSRGRGNRHQSDSDVDHEAVFEDIKAKLGDADGVITQLEKLGPDKQPDEADHVKFWQAAGNIEFVLKFLSDQWSRVQASPGPPARIGDTHSYPLTSAAGHEEPSPYSCISLAKLTNLCAALVPRMDTEFQIGMTPAHPALRYMPPGGDEAFFKGQESWRKPMEADPPLKAAFQTVVSIFRVKRMLVHMANVLTHVSQLTRSTFCGVRYGTGNAYLYLTKCTESKLITMVGMLKLRMFPNGYQTTTNGGGGGGGGDNDVSSPQHEFRVQVMERIMFAVTEIKHDVMALDALAWSFSSPLVSDTSFTEGHCHCIKLPRSVCAFGGVDLGDCRYTDKHKTEYAEFTPAQNRFNMSALDSSELEEDDSIGGDRDGNGCDAAKSLLQVSCDGAFRCLTLYVFILLYYCSSFFSCLR